jgi:hypothetical protein
MTPEQIALRAVGMARGRPVGRYKRVVASWSGGIDSTGVVAHLLARGYHVHAYTLSIYGGSFGSREQLARDALTPVLRAIARAAGGYFTHETASGEFLWAFASDSREIPQRNKRILDWLVMRARDCATTNVAMGEYIGADSWVVRDHVSAADADARALAAYLYLEHGIEWRLLTLADFGESRYKSDRVRLLFDALHEAAFLTSNCLNDGVRHCGACYKCVERAAAFDVAGITDATLYDADPATSPYFPVYRYQMHGDDVDVAFSAFAGLGELPANFANVHDP